MVGSIVTGGQINPGGNSCCWSWLPNPLFSNLTNKNSKCKISKYCTLHFKFLYIKYILLIQSIFRGNKIRNKLNNIYSKLPDELQRLIISKGREYLSYNKYKKVINNIINKKINKIKLKNLNNFNEELYFINLSHLCSLLNKYYCIYDENIINNNIYLYRLVRHLIVIYDYNIYDNNDYTNNYCKLIKYYDLYSELRYI